MLSFNWICQAKYELGVTHYLIQKNTQLQLLFMYSSQGLIDDNNKGFVI